MKTYCCPIAQEGIFAGSVRVLTENTTNISVDTGHGSEAELFSFDNAIAQLKAELSKDTLGKSNADIMETSLMIIEDASFTGEIRKDILNGSPAIIAIANKTDALIAALESSDSDYLQNRCADIRGIAQWLTEWICGDVTPIPLADVPSVSECTAIAADEISPLLLASLPSGSIGALISDKGSPNSHAAIIAGNLGVPYLYGAGEAIAEIKSETTVVVDGNCGKLIVDPDKETYESAIRQMRAKETLKNDISSDASEAVCKTKICANISGPDDLPKLMQSRADGVGLFRTEFLFLNSDCAPSEEEQYAAYSGVLKAMGQKEVIIRTMDVGSDKAVNWMKLPHETNPALGLRGLRVSLEYRDLLKAQLRALLRAAVTGNLKVMFPMVSSEWEVDELIAAVHATAKELSLEGIAYKLPPVGIMIETPAAAVLADDLAKKVSFFSIGTNDLTQYTLAIDREAEGMEKYFNPHHEAVLRLIESVVEKAHACGVTVGICGQLAADPEVTERFIRCGIDELSVPIAKVKATRSHVAEIERAQAVSATGDFYDGLNIAAVADGELIPMAEIPDAAFAEGMLGPCVGILPANGNVYAPCSGTVTIVAETKHAVTVKSDRNAQYLIHMGIDTVKLGGIPFKLFVTTGQTVREGDLIATVDLKAVRDAGCSPIIVTVALTGGKS